MYSTLAWLHIQMEGSEGDCAVKNISPERWRRSWSHKERRTYVNKQRRRYRRRCLAVKREAERKALESQPEYMERICEEERRLAEELRRDEARSMLENAAWLQREKVAQEEFSKKRELEERRRIEREERERLIHEEWEALKRKENEEAEAKEKEKMEKEERLKEALSVGDKLPVTSKESWHNPIAPEGYETSHTPQREVVEVKQNLCSFFLKTGACRFGDRCSRQHPKPTSSCTLLIPSMYSCLGLQEQMLNEQNQDAALEHDEKETYEDFRKFYDDVLSEFSKAGKVVQFKVSCNHETHLRGNVYVQYATEEECAEAFQMFNGRWYAQKQLSCTFCPVTKWKSAICGLFNQRRCPKGKHCNFLHVFPDPTAAFSRADRDLPPLSPHLPHHSSRHSSPLFHSRRQHRGDSTRSFSSSSHQRSRSRSRSESRERSWRKRRHQRPRSRSREKSLYHQSYWRSGSSERSKYNRSHQKSRQRSRSRSESRERNHRRSRSRSKSRERNHRRSRSRESSHSRSESRERSQWNYHYKGIRSRSKSRERYPRLRSESKSPDGRSSSTSSCNGKNHQRSHRKKRKKEKRRSSGASKHSHKSKKKHSRSRHQSHTLEPRSPKDAPTEVQVDKLTVQDIQDKPNEVQDKLTVQNIQDKPNEVQDKLTVQSIQDKPNEVQDKLTVQSIQDKPNEVQDKLSVQNIQDKPNEVQDKLTVQNIQDKLTIQDYPNEVQDKPTVQENHTDKKHEFETVETE